MNGIKSLSDEDLFREFLKENKSEAYFREILQRFKQKVYWQIRRLLMSHDDADEVCQIVFIKLWKNAEQFKFNSKLSSFIFRIAYNESMTFIKSQKRFSSLDVSEDGLRKLESRIEDELMPESSEIEKQFFAALLTLPEKQRLVFNYRYFEEMSYADISEITGTSEGGLKANYHIAVEKLKKFLVKD